MRSYLDSRCLLFGLAAVGWASGCTETDVGFTSQAEAGNICVFVTGQVGGQTITTPSVAVIVPDTEITTDPIEVHVDPTAQSVLGYSLRTPGVDQEVEGQDLFVPGQTQGVPSYTETLPEVDPSHQQCVAAGVTTPAVPIHIPASVLQTPGTQVNSPAITVTFLGQQKTVPGYVLFLHDHQIIVPGADATVPPISVATPEKSVTVTFSATEPPPTLLPPAIILAPRI